MNKKRPLRNQSLRIGNIQLKRADLIMLAVLVIVGIIAIAVFACAGGHGTGKNKKYAVLVQNGDEIGRYALNKDINILVNKKGVAKTSRADKDIKPKKSAQDYNIVTIKDGEISVKEADCPRQICVKHKPIKNSGENIICLPHELVIEIASNEKSDYDSVTK